MRVMTKNFKFQEKFLNILGIARSHFIMTGGSLSLSSATTPHPTCFSKSKRYIKGAKNKAIIF